MSSGKPSSESLRRIQIFLKSAPFILGEALRSRNRISSDAVLRQPGNKGQQTRGAREGCVSSGNRSAMN